jgi:hypothetical protein
MKTIYLLIIVIALFSCKKEENKTVGIKIYNNLTTTSHSAGLTFIEGSVNFHITQSKSKEVYDFTYETSMDGTKYHIPVTDVTDTIYIQYLNSNYNKIGTIHCYVLDERDSIIGHPIDMSCTEGKIITGYNGSILKYISGERINCQ